MKISNGVAYNFFTSSTVTGKQEKMKDAVARFMNTYNLKDEQHNSIRMKFNRLVAGRPRNNHNDTLNKWESEIFLEKSMAGRPSVDLSSEPCTKIKRSVLAIQVENIEHFAQENNIKREEALDMIMNECRRKWNTKEEKRKTMPVTDAASIMFNIGLSVSQYQMLRTLCLPFFSFPTRNTIDSYKRSLYPPIDSKQLKASVNLGDLQQQTFQACCNNVNTEAEFEVIGKFGMDGSGAQKLRHQLVDPYVANLETPHLDAQKVNSIILVCYCPLEIMCQGKTIWKNPIPNSVAYARPVALIRAKEERTILEEEVKAWNPYLKDYSTNLVHNERQVKITFKTEWSMNDGKMVSLLQGDSGAYCHYCTITRDEGNTLHLIEGGFNITKDYKTCSETWKQIESGEIPYSSKERHGQCHEPIIETALKFFSILHFKLRSLDFCLKVLYHLVAGVKQWSESGSILRYLEAAKAESIKYIRERTGMLLDTPTANGGNTNTGGLATRFFSPKCREDVSSIINNTEDRENFRHLLCLLNAYLTVVESYDKKLRNVQKVKEVGIRIMLHIRSSFLNEKGEPWISIIPSIHQSCAHAWELFSWNSEKAISIWSESPVESWNKHIKAYQSGVAAKARQTSMKENLRDVLQRMLIQSNPLIAGRKPLPSCSLCGEVGHTARSSIHKVEHIVQTADVDIINSMLL